jgi:hypothetical protein
VYQSFLKGELEKMTVSVGKKQELVRWGNLSSKSSPNILQLQPFQSLAFTEHMLKSG